jgi:hypothetical protein
MGLPWVRLDTSTFDNPKFLILFAQNRYRTVVVYVAAMAYSGKHETGGFIQREVLPLLQARVKEMNELVEARLMDPVPGGWLIHDWDAFQLSSDEIKGRREKAQHAAQMRWSKAIKAADK